MSSKSPKKSAGSSAEADAKRRRNIILASILGVAVVAVAVIIIASSGGSSKTSSAGGSGGSAVTGVAENKALFEGITQQGANLGDAKAKVTMIEFADLQCPFCKEYTLKTMPVLINDYVRTGKMRMELRTLAFIGPDSQTAAYAAAAAGVQNKEWSFVDLFYRNQGAENSGYVTDQFLDDIFTGAGVNVAQANAYRATPPAKAPLAAADADAAKYGVNSTPSFLIGTTGGPYTKLEVDLADPAGFKAAIDSLLKS